MRNKSTQKFFSLCLTAVTVLVALPSFSGETERKGLLPELKINSTDEAANQRKALQSEVLITKTENQAIQSLMVIIKKQKGSSQEPDLWNRLAELYMRRTKSGRFFDLNRNEKGALSFAPPAVTGETAIVNLKRAVQVYTKIEREFPKYNEMDSVLFNNAFASQQLKMPKDAEALYHKVVTQHPRSTLVPDSYLALGEIAYDKQKFKEALESFNAIGKFPESRVYSYGMYKSAWTMYNLHQSDDAIQKLIDVVKFQDPRKRSGREMNHNLRSESLRDLALFFEETQTAEKANSFFNAIATPDEVGECILNLAKLYDAHARQKEMTLFLAEFLQKQPNSSKRLKMETLLVNGNETARNRSEVLKHLIIGSALCQKNSEWRVTNKDIAEAECDYDFAKTNMEIAKKWWDLWQKNKTATQSRELAELTQEAFRLHLNREDPTKPDTKSRYAYAELLFQIGEFRKATEQYQLVGTKSIDTQTAHDSNYSALVALEKARQKKKEKTDDAELIRISKYYLERYPKGEHVTQVKFKVGFTAYDQGNMLEAEKWLRPIAADSKSGEFKAKSEDLVLDILNARKDFAGIKTFSKELLNQNKDETRKLALTKMMREADYSQIQEVAKKNEKSKAADMLFTFYLENKSSPLAKDSLWQALSLYYSDGKVIQGAETALTYAKAYPDDKRSLDALKDAAKNYADAGFILPAAQTMKMIATISTKDNEKYTEAASELYLIEGKIKEAQETLRSQLSDKNRANHGKILAKLLQTMKGREATPEFKKIEDQILSSGFQPYASEIKMSRIEAIYEAGKLTEAFNSSKSLVGSEAADDDIRARARLVQAKVLEKEFVESRTKTTLEKLAVVLSIKTEKLDKAQTAFLSAAKTAKNPNIKLSALVGLNRIYTNYVDTVGHPDLKDSAQLSAEDKKLLADQLGKLTAPILEKKLDTDKQLQKLAKETKAAGSAETDFASLPVEATVKPQLRNLPVDQLKMFLPGLKADSILLDANRFEATASANQKCGFVETDKTSDLISLSQKANVCALAKNPDQTEKFAFEMTRKDPKSPLGTFYLSLAAEMQGHMEKSAWLVDLSLKKSGEVPFVLYQKARAHYQLKEFAQANAGFIKAFDLGLKIPETVLMHGMVSFAQGDCYSMIEDFAKLDRSWVAKYNLIPAMTECQAQKGEFDKAVATAEESAKASSSPVDLWLQLARIHEIYRFDTAKAMLAYETAFQSAKQIETKDWIQRKITFLKGQQTVSQNEGEKAK